MSLDMCFIVLRRKVLPSLSWVQGLFETLDGTQHISTSGLVLCGVTPCHWTCGLLCYEGRCCLHCHGFRVCLIHWTALSTFLQNVRSNIPSDVTSQHITSHPSTTESSMKTPVRRHENWCNCGLFSGHSFGSAVAYVYSALFPDDVEAYVSIDCVRSLIMVQKEDLLERIRYSLDRSLAVEKRLAFDPPSYSYEELRDLVHIGSIKSLSPESCDKLLERGMKKLPADDR